MLIQLGDHLGNSYLPKLLLYDETPHDTLLRDTLQKRFNFDLLTAPDVETMIEMAYDEKVDLILLDLECASDDGIRIMEYCREVNELQEIPVLAAMECRERADEIRSRFEGVDLFEKPLHVNEIVHRLDIYLKLINKTYEFESSQKILELQLKHIEAILNTQEEMLAVFSEQNIILANSRFLEFFEVETLEEFLLQYDCFAKTFIKEEESFYFSRCDEAITWIDLLKKLPSDERNVVISNTNGTKHRFRIQIQGYTLESNYHVITLFDMTDLYSLSKKYEQFAYYDLLTGVANRRRFEDRLEVEMSRAKRFGNALSLMLFDLDHFKSINDTYGHEKGDAILRAFAKTLSNRVRKEDLFARWGGEEFILLIPETELHYVFELAAALLELTRTINVTPERRLTCSIGISHFQTDMNKHEFIKLADEALYKAKESGRDRFEII